MPEGAELGQPRSVSGSALCNKSTDESLWHLRTTSLSLPEACQASPSQEAVAGAETGKHSSKASDSKLNDLNRPQGAVPAVPEQESKAMAINRPQGAVPTVPVEWSGSHNSSAEQAGQQRSADSSQGTAPLRLEGVPAEDGTDQRHEGSSSAAACSEQEQPQQCGRGGTEKQGCAACIHKHQQQQALQSSTVLKGLDQASFAQSRPDPEPQVSSIEIEQHLSPVKSLGKQQRTLRLLLCMPEPGLGLCVPREVSKLMQ